MGRTRSRAGEIEHGLLALLQPFGCQCAVDDLDDLDEEGPGADRRIEHLDEWGLGCRPLGELEFREAGEHVAPCVGAGQPVFEAELGLKHLVDGTDDEGYDRARGEEDPALDLLFLVVLLEEVLVEVDDRVLAGLVAAPVLNDGVDVRPVEVSMRASTPSSSKSRASVMPWASVNCARRSRRNGLVFGTMSFAFRG